MLLEISGLFQPIAKVLNDVYQVRVTADKSQRAQQDTQVRGPNVYHSVS